MLARFFHRMKEQSESGQMRLAVQWWAHNKSMLFKNKMTNQLRGSQQKHALQQLGALLRTFTEASLLLVISRFSAALLAARASEQVVQSANAAMLDGLGR